MGISTSSSQHEWVFTLKYNPNGMIHRRKACLVSHGFSKTYEIDYNETFSLVVRLNSVQIILSLAVGGSVHQLNVSNAFLDDDLTKCVFMEKPPRYAVQGETTQVCHLHQSPMV